MTTQTYSHMLPSELLKQNVASMSNYSLYFLRHNSGVNINCSVYALTWGSIQYQDYTSGTWSANMSSFLPAYYVSNCSVPDLWAQISEQTVSSAVIEQWYRELMQNPYNKSDNGDAFVALLFMLTGSCVSCWMLSFFFLLSPKPKRKPILTQLAMLFYSVLLTVVFSKVSATTRTEYNAGSLDMVHVLSEMNSVQYFVVYLVLNLLKQIAGLELILTITKHQWRRANAVFVSLITVGSLISGAIHTPLLRDPLHFVNAPDAITGAMFTAFRVIYMSWLGLCLAQYTLFGTATPSKQVAYSRKLLPLALLTWFFIVAFIVVALLLITIWRNDWLTTSWMLFLPTILEMYVLTACWEWIYSIRHLESRLEIVDMLGRRISLEDVMEFNNDNKLHSTPFRGRFVSVRNALTWRRGIGKTEPKIESPVTPFLSAHTLEIVDDGIANGCMLAPDWNTSCLAAQDTTHDTQSNAESSTYEVHCIDTDSWEQHSHYMDVHLSDTHEYPESGSKFVNFLHTGSSVGDDARCDIPSHLSHAPVKGSSAQAEVEENDKHDIDNNNYDGLPPFMPHPGFSKDDYWDEKD